MGLWQHRRRLRLDERTSWRSILVPFLLGLILVGISYGSYRLLYSGLVTSSSSPAVDGSAVIYVDDPRIVTQLQVTFNLAAERPPGRSPFEITLNFTAPVSPSPQSTAVRWALVLYGHARPAEGVRSSENVKIEDTDAADPPLVTGERPPVQVISGTAPLTPDTGQSAATVISGELPVDVFAKSGSKDTLSLPRYGRVQLPLFQSPDQPRAAIDIGIPGPWSRPEKFQVDVDAGPNSAEYRIDTASPSIDDPARLQWQSGESVRALLQRTNLRQEANLTFVLGAGVGAVVGAGIAPILTALERLVSGLRLRAGREPPASSNPADTPEPAD